LRRVALTALAAGALALAGSAAAQAASSYTVGGSASGGGSKSKPVPTGLKLAVKYNGTDRPPTASKFTLAVQGLKVATTGVPVCSVNSLNQAQTDTGCNKAAKVGGGYVKNEVGDTPDQSSITILCNLSVTLYNAGSGRLAVWLKGAPTINVAGATCPIGVNQALDGKLTNTSRGMSLSFTIPPNLMHPGVPTEAQGISEISTTIDKRIVTVKKHGKKTKTSVLSSTGCKGSRSISLTLGLEAGGTNTSTGSAKC